jgi:lia operon protein LiaF
MDRQNRNLAILLIVVGLLIFLSRWISFLTIAALFLIFWGIRNIRENETKRGYTLLFVGGMIFLLDNFTLIIGIILISLGLFYVKSKNVHKSNTVMQKQNLITSIKWNIEPWFLQDISLWHVIGDVDLDLSLAIPDQNESIIVLQGAFGDVDLFIPDDIGARIEVAVLFGQIKFNDDIDTGVLNKRVWQSPHYQNSEYKVKLFISYIVGDIDIRIN